MNNIKGKTILLVLITLALAVGLLWTNFFENRMKTASATGLPCFIFPNNNIWNAPIDSLPVHPRSDDYINRIGLEKTLHPDFGSGVWPPGSDISIGIPYNIVTGNQPLVNITFLYDTESDPGPYPIPDDVLIEGGPHSNGDRHVLLLDSDSCLLYELFDAWPLADGSWSAGSGAVFDLRSNSLRPSGWTSADAAGLPILPGLVRYEEVAAGEIKHAIRFTALHTQRAYVWPARHFASTITDPSYPPMGQRFRLKASYNISGFSHDVQIILQAMKTYGLILADNGSDWYISGAPDERWNNNILRELRHVPGSAFEAVDTSGLMIDVDSGEAKNQYALTVRSANPTFGVVITSNTGHGGSTSYSRTLISDTSVTLTAPEYHGSGASRKRFDRWSGASTSTTSTITLAMSANRTVTAHYVDDSEPATGSIQVFIEPIAARDAGAQWRLTTGPDIDWKDHGETITGLVPGNYTITFKDISGLNSPAAIGLSLEEGESFRIEGP